MTPVRWLLLISTCLAFFGFDLISKSYVVDHISPWNPIAIFENVFGVSFSLEYVKNTGAALGFFSSMQTALLWGRVLIIIALLVYLFRATLSPSRIVSLAFVLTGAIGNVVDYFLYGHVVDMLHFSFRHYSFAVFNLADSLISCGVAALLIGSLREKKLQKIENL